MEAMLREVLEEACRERITEALINALWERIREGCAEAVRGT